MSKQMVEALVLLMRNGVVFAGGGNEVAHGSCMRVAAPTVAALAKRGFAVLCLSHDGGMMAVRP